MFSHAKSILPAAAAAITTTLAASLASATGIPSQYGSFMVEGGNTSDGSAAPGSGFGGGYCMQAYTSAGAVYLKEEGCVSPIYLSSGSINYSSTWGSSEQEFEIVKNGGGTGYNTVHLIVSGVDKGCLDLDADYINLTTHKGTLDIATCTTFNQAQGWEFSNGSLCLSHNHTGYCVAISGGTVGNGTAIDVEWGTGQWPQNWLPINFSVRFQSQINTNLCLDVKGNNQVRTTEIDNGTCNGTTAQMFTFEPWNTQYFHGLMMSTNNTNGAPADTCGPGGVAQPCVLMGCGGGSYCNSTTWFGAPVQLEELGTTWDNSFFYEYSVDQTLTNANYQTSTTDYGTLEGSSTAASQVYEEGINLFNLSSGMQWNMTLQEWN